MAKHALKKSPRKKAKKGLRLSKKDLKELKEEMERNRKQRMEFVNMYADWLKKTPNKVWSKQQAKYLNK